MQVISDLQLHSKYARAVSPQMVIPEIWKWAKRKGIGLIATGDWTHPLWLREIKAETQETGTGLLQLKNRDAFSEGDGPLFLLEAEVSSIYSQGGKLRRIHNLIWSPSIASCEKINKELTSRGCNLLSDGRPIIGLTSIQVAELVFSIDPHCLIIPAHIWTPHFSLFGSESGFDSIDECFGQLGKYIFAVETGLSSDPAMNWRIKELDSRSIVSFSDAHSGPKLAREATVFELESLSFENIRKAIILPSTQKTSTSSDPANNHIAYTIEFYPEEGKYHYTGHRNCGIKQSPKETKSKGTICPVCGKKLTVGVMHRVDQLAGRSEQELGIRKKELEGIVLMGIYSDKLPQRPPYIMMVPLPEILSESLGGLPTGKTVVNEYMRMTDHFGSELSILLQSDVATITKFSGEKVAQAIDRVRKGDISVDPGYDGVFGKVKIWSNEDKNEKQQKDQKEQMSLF